jgi:hypothetical protein
MKCGWKLPSWKGCGWILDVYINKKTLEILSFCWKIDVDDIKRPQKMFSTTGFIFETRVVHCRQPAKGMKKKNCRQKDGHYIIPCLVGINSSDLVDRSGNCKSTFKKCYKKFIVTRHWLILEIWRREFLGKVDGLDDVTLFGKNHTSGECFFSFPIQSGCGGGIQFFM